MREFIFTFGAGQKPHGLGKYVSVMAATREAARKAMVEAYGSKWAFQYDTPEEAGVARFGLVRVDTLYADCQACPKGMGFDCERCDGTA